MKADGADVFVQHLSLGEPGVRMAHASWTGDRDRAQRVTDLPGRGFECLPESNILDRPGFVDPGFGNVHRVIAGPSGAEIYSTFFLPPGSENHLIVVPALEECS